MNNIAEMLRIRAQTTPDKPAVRYLEQEVTWRQLYLQSCYLSRRLEQGGVGRGDVVGIYIGHSLGQVVALFAVSMRDAVFTLVNPLLAPEQVKHQVQDASMMAVVGSVELLSPMADFFSNRTLYVETIQAIGTTVDDEDAATDLDTSITNNIPADVSNYIYTSGSTGLPRGVVVPHRTLLDGARIVSQYLGITAEDNLLGILPLSFDYGLNQLMSCVYTGARITLHQFIFPGDLLDILVDEEITGMAVVPSVWPKLLKSGQKKDREFRSLRYVTTGGGFHPPELLQDAVKLFPHSEIIVMYGLTESFRSTYLPFSEITRRPGSIGKAVPEVEVLVLNKSGEPCKPGEKGELIHRGAFVNYGYLNNPEESDKKFIHLRPGSGSCLSEVAVRSGDLVSADEEGYLYFHGRMDMLIKSSGYRISPDEVARAVLSTPGLVQAAVFAMPDELLGEAIHVAYETSNHEVVDIADIKRHARNLLASYAVPHHFHFYKKLPLNANAKVDVNSLKREVLRRAQRVATE